MQLIFDVKTSGDRLVRKCLNEIKKTLILYDCILTARVVQELDIAKAQYQINTPGSVTGPHRKLTDEIIKLMYKLVQSFYQNLGLFWLKHLIFLAYRVIRAQRHDT